MSNQDLHIYHHLTPLPYLTYTHYLIGQYQLPPLHCLEQRE